MAREAKTVITISLCTLLGIGFAVASACDLSTLLASLYSQPSDPTWTAFIGVGLFAGFSQNLLMLVRLIYRQKNPTINRVAIGGKHTRIRLKFIIAAIACSLFLLPTCYVIGSILFSDEIRNWIDAIPCLASGVFFYLGFTYPYSFKWSPKSGRTDPSPSSG